MIEERTHTCTHYMTDAEWLKVAAAIDNHKKASHAIERGRAYIKAEPITYLGKVDRFYVTVFADTFKLACNFSKLIHETIHN